MTTYVEKMDGKREAFSPDKVKEGIWLAAKKVGGKDKALAYKIGEEIVKTVLKKYKKVGYLKTSEMGNLIERTLIEKGYTSTAQEFIRFRENKKHLAQDKNSLGITDDIGLSYNTLFILKERYLKRNEKGEIVETPRGMIERVAKHLSSVEKTEEEQKKWYQAFFDLMVSFDFLPGTRTLANSGKRDAQIANCFVFEVEDDVDMIFDILHKSTLIKKHGGGCGYNFSKIRAEGDPVGGVPGLAAGPIKMIEMFNLMTSLFRQEGKYESGNMAILNANHPDIFNFIAAKKTDGYLSKTNISVGITDDFMNAATNDKPWYLISPRTGEIVNTVSAKSILNLMAQMAWATGDPGLINLSAINKGNRFGNPLLKKRGQIMATNVCGEIPLFPFESCNLGYLNLPKFIKGNKFDFKRLEKTMKTAVRLMDNVIDAAWFPVREVDKAVRNHRRLGIGAVGWAETLIMLGISYDSDEAVKLAEKVVKTMYFSAFEASCKLAKEKGPFPLVMDSIWAKSAKKPRNVALITFPPSSGNAVICETSFGIEPLFAVAYEQNIMGGTRLKTVNPLFLRELEKRGIDSTSVIEKVISNHGSVQGIKEVPKDMQKVFRVAHDISWQDLIKMQAAFQKYTDNAITKTINMPSTVTPNEVEESYKMAWKLGCKGLTIYRDKTKADQVFDFGGKKEEINADRMCPTCNIKLVKDNKCFKCKKCGFSTCEL